MLDLFDELRAICGALDAAEIPHALVGGLAVSVWVQPRNTVDIDLLVRADDWERIVELLLPLGYRALAAPMDFQGIRIRRLTKLEQGDSMVADFLFADGDLADGIENRVVLEYEGNNYAVAPPSVLITLKEGRMSPQDRVDIEGLRKLIGGEDQ